MVDTKRLVLVTSLCLGLFVFGLAIGWTMGITVFSYNLVDHLDKVKSINIQFNETAMVDAVLNNPTYQRALNQNMAYRGPVRSIS